MRRCILSFLVLLLFSISFSETPQETNPLFRITVDDKYGYIDRQGKVVIEPQYVEAGIFSEGLAPAKTTYGWWKYIDKTGKMVIESQFDDVDYFVNGIARVSIGEKYGYINKTGKYIWESTK